MLTHRTLRVIAQFLVPALLVVTLPLGIVGLLVRPDSAHAAVDLACLGVSARIMPSKDSLL